jgi:hypothetical protein
MYYCRVKENCPYLRYRSSAEVLDENDYWKKRVEHMQELMKLAEEKIKALTFRLQELETEKKDLQEELNQAIRKPFKSNLKKDELQQIKKKRGAPVGHHGVTRKRPVKIDEYFDVYPAKCNKCGSEEITVYTSFEEHIVEDIEIKVKTTCFKKHFGYCRKCQKVIYPESNKVIPKSHIGPVARATGGYLRYVGIPFDKVQKIFNDLFGFKISSASLVSYDRKMGENGLPVYEQIKQLVKHSSSIHGDETGWRVDGENFWLWNFVNSEAALYRIEKSRGSEVVKDTLGEDYQGTLISDFYSAYNDKIKAKNKQKCITHLLKEIKEIEEKNKFQQGNIEQIFCENLKSILKEALEIWNKFRAQEKTLEELKQFKEIIAKVLTELVLYHSENKDIQRIKKRLVKHNNELLTFLDHPEIEPTNNRAERQLRPNVIMRKITFGNRSQTGVRNHQVIMSVLETAKLNGLNPIDVFRSLSTNLKDLSFLPEKTRAP